jgi:uncharacterized protein (TIGR02099 family)
MQKIKLFLIRVVNWMWLMMASLIILLAICLVVVRQFILPNIDEYRVLIQGQLSESFGRAVTIGELHATWSGLGPVFRVNGLNMTAAHSGERIKVESIQVAVNLWQSVLTKQLTTKDIVVNGLELKVEEFKPFEYRVSALDASQDSQALDVNPIIDLIFNQRFVSFQFVSVELHKFNQSLMDINLTELTIQNEGGKHHLKGNAEIDQLANYSILASLDGDPRLNNGTGDIFIGADKVPLETLPLNLEQMGLEFSGETSIKSWLTWSNGGIEKGLLAVDAEDVNWNLAETTGTSNSNISIEFDLLRTDKDSWFFQLSTFEVNQVKHAIKSAVAKLSLQANNKFWLGSVESIDLSILQLLGELPLALLDLNIQKGDRITGALRDWRWYIPIEVEDNGLVVSQGMNQALSKQFSKRQLTSYSGFLDHLMIENKSAGIRVKDLNLTVEAIGNKGVVSLANQSLHFNWLDGFVKGIDFGDFNGDVIWESTDELFSLQSPSLKLSSVPVSLNLGFELLIIDSDAPQLALSLRDGSVDVTAIEQWLPTRTMGDGARLFLADAFESGHIHELNVNWFSEWTGFNSHSFDNLTGTANLNAFSIKFDSDWPSAGLKSASLELLGDSIVIDSASAHIANLDSLNARTLLSHYAGDNIAVFVDSEQPINIQSGLEWITKTPLEPSLRETLQLIDFSRGKVNTKLNLYIPLTDLDGFNYGLDIRFSNYDLGLFNGQIPINDLSGNFYLDKSSFNLKQATGKLFSDVKSSFRLDGTYEESGLVKINVDSQGLSNINQILNQFWKPIPGIEDIDTPIVINGEVRSTEDATSYKFRLIPDLSAMKLDLPPPLFKPKTEDVELVVFLSGRDQNLDLDVNFNNNLHTRQRLQLGEKTKWLGGDIRINGAEAADFNEPNTMLIDAKVKQVQLTDWISWLNKFSTEEEAAFEIFSLQGGVQVDQLLWEQVDLGKVNITFQPDENQMVFILDGDNIEGQLHVNHQNQMRLVLQHAHLPELPESWFATNDVKDNDVKQNQINSFNTKNFPELQIQCVTCTIKKLEFTGFKLHARHQEQGVSYQFSAQSERETKVIGSGRWRQDLETQHFGLTGSVQTKSINYVLSKLDQDLGVRKSGAQINFDFNYTGDILQFDISRLQGNIIGNIDGGQLLEVDDKGARILSILSLQNIVRRLFLDFSNLFEQGFFFDDIKLNLVLSDAKLYANEVKIDGDAADIQVSGMTDLRLKTLHQRAIVTPELTESLPVLAGWAVEPMTGLVVLILSEIFNPAIEVMTQSEMEISGTWAEPITTEVKRTKEKVKISQKIIQQGKALNESKESGSEESSSEEGGSEESGSEESGSEEDCIEDSKSEGS